MAAPSPEVRRVPGNPVFSRRRATAVLLLLAAVKRPVCVGKVTKRIGRLTDLVFRLGRAVPGGGRHLPRTRLGPAHRVHPLGQGNADRGRRHLHHPDRRRQPYPPFVDQPGWILLNEHLMGRTILDMDGRRTEVVNDVHLLASQGRMLLVHVDISFNGFLRKWGLGWLSWGKDRLISWRYVQPLSLEDVGTTDAVSPLDHPQADQGPARRRPGRRPGGAFRQGAAGGVLRPRLREGRRSAGRGRAPGPAADHRQSPPRAGPHRSSPKCRSRSWPTCSPCCPTTTWWR